MSEDTCLPRRARPRLAFSTQTLLLQLAVILLVVVSTTVVYGILTYQRLVAEAESRALAVAQAVASDFDASTFREVTTYSAAVSLPTTLR